MEWGEALRAQVAASRGRMSLERSRWGAGMTGDKDYTVDSEAAEINVLSFAGGS